MSGITRFQFSTFVAGLALLGACTSDDPATMSTEPSEPSGAAGQPAVPTDQSSGEPAQGIGPGEGTEPGESTEPSNYRAHVYIFSDVEDQAPSEFEISAGDASITCSARLPGSTPMTNEGSGPVSCAGFNENLVVEAHYPDEALPPRTPESSVVPPEQPSREGEASCDESACSHTPSGGRYDPAPEFPYLELYLASRTFDEVTLSIEGNGRDLEMPVALQNVAVGYAVLYLNADDPSAGE